MVLCAASAARSSVNRCSESRNVRDEFLTRGHRRLGRGLCRWRLRREHAVDEVPEGLGTLQSLARVGQFDVAAAPLIGVKLQQR